MDRLARIFLQLAVKLSRGAQRLLRSAGLKSLTEVSLPSGRRADLMALGADGEIWIVEIKSSIEDFRADHVAGLPGAL